MIQFPSLQWFVALKQSAESDPQRYRRLGTADLVLVVKIDFDDHCQCYEIVFAGYHCTSVRQIGSPSEAAAGAVTVEGRYAAWREMVESIQQNGKADLAHTLNTLTLPDVPLRLAADNQLDIDRFYRYQQTLQEFFDEAGRAEAGLPDSEKGTAPARA